MPDTYPPTRAAGLARLQDFMPRMGITYANGRNTDLGPDGRSDVSGLSPYLRRRLLTEEEVVSAAQAAHGEGAEKFIQEVAWRTYFKGYLEQHPTIWSGYLADVKASENRICTESGLRRVYHDACEGRTGIDGFDSWAHELVSRGWLHNHARMWFASIWVFTLRLPWSLGAAFFMRHLLDGDPASNTLSWRWVAGLHTKGKHYVARAENIARYTNGRFHPRGQLDETPESLTEEIVFPRVPLPDPDAVPPGRIALLLHDEDLCPETLPIDMNRVCAVAMVGTCHAAGPVMAFAENAMDDVSAWLAKPVTHLLPCEVADWISGQERPVVTPWAPVGSTASLLDRLPLCRIRRSWDNEVWPHATRGFFQVKRRLPRILAGLA